MKALTKVLAGSAVVAAMAAAAPAAAQYYPYGGYGGQPVPGPGYGYGNYGNYGNYGVNQQAVVSQCTAAVQQRLGGYGYGSGYSTYGAGRVLGISRVEPRGDGGLQVSGVASSGNYGAYSDQPDLTFRCRTDYRGVITWVDVKRAQRAYRPYNDAPYGNPSPYGNNTGPYGYSRY